MSGLDAELALRIRLLCMDVDGVLTDNGLFIGPIGGERVELKRFDVQDGLGIVLLRAIGLPVVWLSGRHSEATALRARELKIEEVLQVPGPTKLSAMEVLLRRRGIEWSEVAYIGDDLADLQVLKRVGLPIAVANAVQEIKEAAHFVTRASGGYGAVREAIEALLKARGVWPEILERYFSHRPVRAG